MSINTILLKQHASIIMVYTTIITVSLHAYYLSWHIVKGRFSSSFILSLYSCNYIYLGPAITYFVMTCRSLTIFIHMTSYPESICSLAHTRQVSACAAQSPHRDTMPAIPSHSITSLYCT